MLYNNVKPVCVGHFYISKLAVVPNRSNFLDSTVRQEEAKLSQALPVIDRLLSATREKQG